MKMPNIVKQFKHDLEESVVQDITRKNIRYGRIIFASILLGCFVLSKSFFNYYLGVMERRLRIQKLRSENKLLPQFDEALKLSKETV